MDALKAQGIGVAAVCPAALLALQGARRRLRDQQALTSDAVLWQDGPMLHLFMLADGQPTAWTALPAEIDDVAIALAGRVLSRRAGLRVAAIHLNAGLLRQVESLPDITITHTADLAADDAVLTAADQILGARGPAGRARVRRGDAGPEVRLLLTKLIAVDTRPNCVAWAKETLALNREKSSDPPSPPTRDGSR